MDAVKFIKERDRMCRSFKGSCKNCAALIDIDCENALRVCAFDMESSMNAKDQVAIVDKWANANPLKTRQNVFLKQNPDAAIDRFGVLRICPMFISADRRTNGGKCNYLNADCAQCRQEFWNEEVE